MTPPSTAAPGPDVLPLTGAQAGIWLAEQAERDGRVRCVAEYFDIPGPIEVEAFRAAWGAAFAETDVLRVTVVETSQTLSQVIGPLRAPHIPVVDYRGDPDAYATAVTWMNEDVARPIDLTGDIYTVVLFQIEDSRFLWYQKCHHLAMDGYSGAIFAQRVCAQYEALVAGRPAESRDFASLRDLVAEDAVYASSPEHDLDRTYWRDLLDGCPPPFRPASAGPEAAPGGCRVSATLPEAEYAGLRLALGRSVPPVIIAAYAMYYAMLTGLDDVVLGLPVISRKGTVARRTPGMMSNVMPVRLRIGADLTFRNLARIASAQVRESLKHQRYRVEELRRDLQLGLDEQLFLGPVVNIMAFPVTYALGGHPLVARNLSNGPANDHALAVYDRHDGRGLALDLDGNTQFYTEPQLTAHLEGFVELLRTVTADPDLSVLVHAVGPVADRARAAPEPAPARAARPRAGGRQATEQERVVADLFAQVLGVTEVGVDESFFEIGGDSITAIAFAARAREAGLPIVLRQLFVGQTPAAIAASLAAAEPAAAPAAEGPARLTALVKRVTDEGGPISSLHQSVLVQAPADLDLPRLGELLATIVDRHDVLRSRLSPTATLDLSPPGTVEVAPWIGRVDAAGVVGAEWTALVAAETLAAARRLAPRSGVMLQAVWFDRGALPGRVLLVVHHLVIDAPSWPILLRDLWSGWTAIRADGGGAVPPRGGSGATSPRDDGSAALPRGDASAAPPQPGFAAWSARFEAAAADPGPLAELPHWLETLADPEPLIGGRPLDRASDLASAGGRLVVTLSREDAAILGRVAPEALHARVEDVLLGALTLAIGEWRRRGGLDAKTGTVLIDLTRDGRPDPALASDYSGTVGNFTFTVPVRLPTGKLDWSDVVSGAAELVDFVLATKDSLRRIPGRGDGFDLLRFVNPATAGSLEAGAAPQISFTCREQAGDSGTGDSGTGDSGTGDWAVVPETDELPDGRDPSTPFSHALLIDVDVRDRPAASELRALIRWPLGLIAPAELAAFAGLFREALHGIATAVTAVRTARHSPTDLTMGGLSQQEIDELEAELEGLA